MPEAVAKSFVEQLAVHGKGIRFVTRDNQSDELHAELTATLGADAIQCEGCTRGDVPVLDQLGGYYWHAAPEVQLTPDSAPMRGRPFRCLKLSRDPATAQSAD